MNPITLLFQLCASLSRVISMADDITASGQALTRTARAAAENYETKTQAELDNELQLYIASLNDEGSKASVAKTQARQGITI